MRGCGCSLSFLRDQGVGFEVVCLRRKLDTRCFRWKGILLIVNRKCIVVLLSIYENFMLYTVGLLIFHLLYKTLRMETHLAED